MRDKTTIFFIVAVVVLVGGLLGGAIIAKNIGLPGLPYPELSEGERGKLGIDRNINESTIDKYLGRSDSVYIDVRMLDDPADYGAIGGDSKLSGFVDGFEVVPYPYIVNVSGLPEAVGSTYAGETLFTYKDNEYSANYVEAPQILKDLFPMDKFIFLMCGGGGYSGMLKNMLIDLGWNEDNIYVVGGYWYYEGEHNVKVKQDDGSYAFWKVPYHQIDFSKLTKV